MEQNTLYRKYRPLTFDDVVGQDVIVRTLRNQIENDKTGHAYLFCGTRGTGKTTIAKIFARAVNCIDKHLGNPCNKCTTCTTILDGSNLNIVELDAASNNSIDNIRRIIELLNHPPIDNEKYKVFIIDEAHGLSPAACNALLKTLEEPPAYAKFILCTTEPEKLLDTIRSRCQRYDFTRIELDVIKNQLKKICDAEKINIDDEALTFISIKGDGSMRDSISLLERCRGFIKDNNIDIDVCKNVLGIVDNKEFIDIYKALLNQDTKKVFEKIGEIINLGKDINVFVGDFIWFLRNCLVVKTINKPSDKLSITKESFDDYKKLSEEASLDTLIYYIEKLSELSHKLKTTIDKRIILETTFLKLSIPQADSIASSYLSRISILEDDIKNNSYKKIDATRDEFASFDDTKKKDALIKELKVDKATYEDIKNLKDHMNEIISTFDMMTKNLINKCNFIPDKDKRDGVVNIIPPSEPIYDILLKLEKEKNLLTELSKRTKEVIKKEVRYVVINKEKEHIAKDIILTIENLGIPLETEQ